METWVIAPVAIAVLVLVGLAFWAVGHARSQRLRQERRIEAAERREEAELRALRASEREQVAEGELVKAQRT